MKKKILITGGSGFIGTNLVNYLSNKGYNITNLDKISYASTPEIFKKNVKRQNYRFLKIDLANKNKVLKIFKKIKPNIIINLAAETHVDRSIDNSDEFIKSNILGTYNLINIINKTLSRKEIKKLKFIHISTDEVYGSNKLSPSKENDQYNPSSPYSASKASANHLVKSFGITFNIPITILNFCNNYGPYQFPEKFIPTVIINALKKKVIPIYGNGKNIREWIFVEDCCKAIESTFSKVKFGNEYNIGSGYRTDNLTIAKMICKLLGKVEKYDFKKLIRYVKDRPGHDFRYALNSSKFKNKTKWKPKTSIENGLKETINWYIKNKKWFKYTQKKYSGSRLGKI
ncbi:MAG: dTDP-glucose 4,6-dehydratase [Candidatus Pelagibacter sp. TMED64]|nr:dTDP-glucose 4,6-dehydratase [Candidatus Pelagibacter sp.]OUU66217.1 MAG: dTDP-glucose 4,6-dehydratase [Candidatus Pelagibacter sp. TMED64]|tara:strand:- start:1331 stop:2359 length:1029 start_codon:yes stop_codon:yes gene_type:complete